MKKCRTDQRQNVWFFGFNLFFSAADFPRDQIGTNNTSDEEDTTPTISSTSSTPSPSPSATSLSPSSPQQPQKNKKKSKKKVSLFFSETEYIQALTMTYFDIHQEITLKRFGTKKKQEISYKKCEFVIFFFYFL